MEVTGRFVERAFLLTRTGLVKMALVGFTMKVKERCVVSLLWMYRDDIIYAQHF